MTDLDKRPLRPMRVRQAPAAAREYRPGHRWLWECHIFHPELPESLRPGSLPQFASAQDAYEAAVDHYAVVHCGEPPCQDAVGWPQQRCERRAHHAPPHRRGISEWYSTIDEAMESLGLGNG